MKNLLVLGATGSCGKFFVQHAIDAGHRVRAIVRSPERVTSDRFTWAGHPDVMLVKADLLDAQAVGAACEGVDAVISMVGPPPGADTSPLPPAIRAVVAGMRAHGVRRLIVQGGGFVKLEGEPTLIDRGLRAVFAAAMNEAAVLKGNDEMARFLVSECDDIDWTITRPGLLSDDGPAGVVEAMHDYGPGMPGGTPSKVDLTRWYIDLIDDARATHKAPAPGYAAEDDGFATSRVAGQKRVAVITGANSGLGRETARVLLMKGMRVVCACRNPEKGRDAVASLLTETADRPDPSPDDARFMALDVSSLASVRTFAQAYQATGLPLHVLLCNAGIMMGPQRASVDGIELQLATNYLGHFELCRVLRDVLVDSAPARVVHVSSLAARFGSILLEELNQLGTEYNSQAVYSMTKLMQVVFSRTLSRRLEGTGVTSHSLEPGVVATNLSKGVTDDPAMQRRLEQGVSVEEGARTHIFLCSAVQLTEHGGSHWQDCKDISQGVAKWRYLVAAHSLRSSMDDALWDASEALIAAHAPSSG